LESRIYLEEINENFLSKCKWSKDYNVFELFNLKDKVIFNYKILDVYIIRRSIRCDCICLCGKKSVEKEVNLLHIVRGAKKSCGCYRALHRARYLDDSFIGNIYNNLKVISILSEKEKEEFISKYNLQNIKNKILWKCSCLLCGNEVILPAFKVVTNRVTNCGCVMKDRNTKYKDRGLIGSKVNNIQILDIIDKRGEKTYWVLKCPFCNSVYISDASHTANGHRKSCGCLGKSFGEKSIKKILENLNISFKQEQIFQDLLGEVQNKHTYLRYDFLIYLNENIVGSIEFDGLHHFFIEYQRGCYTIEDAEAQLARIQLYDKKKDEYMLSKGVKPLHIKYTKNFDEIEKQVLVYLRSLNLL